jgi:hypothetical protein
MNKEEILKSIAELGYNVGFGAKKHFATYDIVEKTPGRISFFSTAFGIYALVFEGLSTKSLSASLLILGLLGVYISLYQSKKDDYCESGEKLTKIFYKLRDLYGEVKGHAGQDCSQYMGQLEEIRNEYFGCCMSNQIFLSDWFAHYKFFWQQQIEWIDEQKQFRFLRDKIPLTLTLFVLAIVVVAMIVAWKIELFELFRKTLCTS